MARKPKFKPEIRRIKLNPEQAVLTCNCYSRAMWWRFAGHHSGAGKAYGVCELNVSSPKSAPGHPWCVTGGVQDGLVIVNGEAASS